MHSKLNRFLIFISLIFPFIKPQLFDEYIVTTYLYYALKLSSSLLVLFLYGKKFKFHEISSCVYLVLLFRAVSIIPTLNNPDGDIIKYLGITVFDIAFVMIIQWCTTIDKKLFLKIVIGILEFWVLINTISLFVPDLHFVSVETSGSLAYSSLLGGDNRYIFFYLPLLFLKIVYANKYKKDLSLNDYIWYVICLSTLMYTKAAAALVGVILFIPFINYMRSERKYRIVNYNFVLVAFFALNILFVFFRIQSLFSYLIVDVLHKDLTLSYRTFVWDCTLLDIAKSPILGYGYETVKGVMKHCHGANHPHNFMLTLLLRGGIVGLISYCSMLLYANVGLKKCQHDKNYKVFTFVMAISLLLCIFDSFDYVFFYLILFAPAFLFE